ncbi:ISH9-type transposase [Halorubrum sp. AJ67]|nr:ISH9-type transposase [Halorubrum sp. AJ67]
MSNCFRVEETHSYRETPNRLKYMAEVRDALDLDQDDLPDHTTIYKSFDRLKMWVWRALLRVSAQQHPQSGHVALDSTFFDRRRASLYFRQRAGRTIQTLKATTLTDVESIAVLDVHIAARWKHDTKTGPQVVAADNGFQDWHTEYEIAAHDVEYLVHYRGSSAKAAANNALNRANGYAQRWMAETSYSTTKRSLGDAVRALAGIDSSVKLSSCSPLST